MNSDNSKPQVIHFTTCEFIRYATEADLAGWEKVKNNRRCLMIGKTPCFLTRAG